MFKKIRSFPLLFALLVVISSCRLYNDQVELERSSVWRYYLIDAKSIREQIAKGKTDVFTELGATPEAVPTDSASLIDWRQDDYFRVANALHEITWNEPLDAQNLYSMSFTTDCLSIEKGALNFSSAQFASYKVVQVGDDEVRFERWITVAPSENLVYSLDVEFSPNVNIRKPFDPTQHKITADDGLKIAETNGGEATRLKIDNKCQISGIAPTPDYKYWQIYYAEFPNLMDILFKVAIDPQTGEYSVLFPDP